MAEEGQRRTLATSLLASIRAYQYHRARGGPWSLVMRRLARLKRNLLSLLTASDIDVMARFGRNLRLPHPNGVVIHGDVVIGDDCLVMQQVTIGLRPPGHVPRLGSRVYVGAGAKILGSVTIGDDARIGANAVVLSDVPAGATAVGIPARIVRQAPPNYSELPSTTPTEGDIPGGF